eukprot:Anaeramoba_flamelloidesc34583_g1_i1.p2 GENE.c34583_g1_i1~~c34583_g1_i1.p2  ORF type:complete len:100 (+),score=11.35 c34583_g1_i1:143-442(+)
MGSNGLVAAHQFFFTQRGDTEQHLGQIQQNDQDVIVIANALHKALGGIITGYAGRTIDLVMRQVDHLVHTINNQAKMKKMDSERWKKEREKRETIEKHK